MKIRDAEFNGCEFTLNQAFEIITEPAAITVSATHTDASCFGVSNGTVTLSAAGGIAPYSYTLGTTTQASGSFTGLAAGTYNYSVTGVNNCPAVTGSVTIIQPPLVVVDPVSNATWCNNASGAAITFSSPTPGGTITYDWTSTVDVGFGTGAGGNIPAYTASNNSNIPVTTTVSVTGTLNGCTGLPVTFTITVNPRPTGSISGSTTICSGNSAALSITVTGTGPWSGTLSDGTTFSGNSSPISLSVSPATTTSYTIASLSDANCTAEPGDLTGSSTTVTVNSAPSFTLQTSNHSRARTGSRPPHRDRRRQERTPRACRGAGARRSTARRAARS